jgi:hypothetical protein
MGAYETTRQRHIEHLLPQIGEHFERVTWSPERLHAERTARLRELVAIAVERSSWHRDRLADLDLTAASSSSLMDSPPSGDRSQDVKVLSLGVALSVERG